MSDNQEPPKDVQEEQKEEKPQEEKIATESVRPEYSGDKGYHEAQLLRKDAVETKVVPKYSFGKRVRIAALNTP
jgi:hypothetical protein